MKTIHYSNATKKQIDYIEQRIERDIFCLDNHIVEYLLSTDNDLMSYDNIENIYPVFNPAENGPHKCDSCGEETEIDAGTNAVAAGVTAIPRERAAGRHGRFLHELAHPAAGHIVDL